MIAQISSWASNVVIAVIIATVIEMILPDSKNKKYVKTVIGMFILFTIIAPVITKISGEEFSLESIAKGIDIENNFDTETQKIDTDDYIRQVYVDNLKKDLTSKVSEKGYAVNDINVSVSMQEGDNYGKIESISINIVKKNDEQEENSNEIPTVNAISIDINESKESSNNNSISLSEKECKEVQEYISKYYGVDRKNINVY